MPAVPTTSGLAALVAACDRGDRGDKAAAKKKAPSRVVFWSESGGAALAETFAVATIAHGQQFLGNTLEYTALATDQIQDKLLVSWTSGVVPVVIEDSSRAF